MAELFTSDADVIDLAVGLTPWVMLFCSLDSTQIVMVGALTALAKQKFAAPLQMVGYILIGLPLGSLLAFYHANDDTSGSGLEQQEGYVHVYGIAIGMGCGCCVIWLGFGVLLGCCVDFEECAKETRQRLQEEKAEAAS